MISGIPSVRIDKLLIAYFIDNVRFEGELIPVDLVLSEMTEEAGFEVKEIIGSTV